MLEYCTNCNKLSTIVMRDGFKFGTKEWDIYKLCPVCAQKIFPEQTKEILDKIKDQHIRICSTCGVYFTPQEDWNITCFDCWKREKEGNGESPPFNIKNLDEREKKVSRILNLFSLWNGDVQVSKMSKVGNYIQSTKNEPYSYYYDKFNSYRILEDQITIEIEFSPHTRENFLKNWLACGCVCNNLVRENIPFIVYFAKGMKAPHICIYQVKELKGLTDFQRREVRKLFTYQVVPKQYHKVIDTSMFQDQKLPIPFSKHWKYNTFYLPIASHGDVPPQMIQLQGRCNNG